MTASNQRFQVEPEEAGRRIDQVLSARLPRHSRAEIQRWLKSGLVRVARPDSSEPDSSEPGPSIKPKWPCPEGAWVQVAIPSDDPVPLRAEPLGVGVLHRDDDFLVCNKPPGMVVHPSPGHSSGTLVNALLHTEGEELSTVGGEERPGIVHRLDRDTSGVIVVARTDFAHREIARQFKDRETKKVYLAITRGVPRSPKGTIEGAIGRSRHDRKRMAIDPGGRPSLTRYKVEEVFAKHALVRCFPRTGRTHQIRVHLHSIGTPILCDELYAPQTKVLASALSGARRPKNEAPLLTRHALHAFSLGFAHPRTGEPLSFEAPLPDDLEAVLAALRISE